MDNRFQIIYVITIPAAKVKHSLLCWEDRRSEEEIRKKEMGRGE